MKTIQESTKKRPWLNWVIFIGTAIVVFFIGLFAASIIDRRSESKLYFQQTREIAEWEPDNAVWGENYPREYETFLQTADTSFRSLYGGSSMRDLLAEDPHLVTLWAGYAFSREYNQARGHMHAVEDIKNILRTGVPQPATCWSCKSPDVPRMMHKLGPEKFYQGKWADMGKEIVNPIGCQDCHDPKTMNLRISRPALIEAFQRQGRDINKATHQEMRSLVCAQCHVEYYFKGEGKYLTFPWDKGFSADSMESYYNQIAFTDFEHGISKTPILKAQHPDYEVFMTGVHAERGVACADCHMPYRREGAIKFTDHHIQSPLNNISGSCLVCHRESEEQMRKDVYERQNKIYQVKLLAEQSLVLCHYGVKIALEKGAGAQELKPVYDLIRSAQWRWDWVSSSNGVGFHSPVESMRVLATSLDRAQEARILLSSILTRHGVKIPYGLPDLSTKEKAQLALGLDMPKLKEEKKEFLTNVASKWK